MALWLSALLFGAFAWSAVRAGRSARAFVGLGFAMGANLVLIDRGVTVSQRLVPILAAVLVGNLVVLAWERRKRS